MTMKQLDPTMRWLAPIAALALLAWSIPGTARADDWRQVGFFRSDGGNISVGDAHVRVVTTPDIPPDLMEAGMMADTAKINLLYPGWDYHSSLELHYQLTPTGYRQAKFLYTIGQERKALPGDTIPATFAVFDLKDKWRATIPSDLHELIGATVPIKAAAKANLDADPAPEWVIVVAGPKTDSGRGVRMKVSLIDRDGAGWQVLAVFAIDAPRVAGPLEVRDVTGDGKPDVVFRTFHETTGHFWIEARIFSTHAGLPSVLNPAPMRPTTSTNLDR
jgi:hypothetical protein